MEFTDFENYIGELNAFFDDKELNKLHEQLKSFIEAINSKPELDSGLKRLKELHDNSPLQELSLLNRNKKLSFLRERVDSSLETLVSKPKMKIDIKEMTFPEVEEALISRIRALRSSLDIGAYVVVKDLNDEILDKLAEGALSDPCIVTNPRSLTKKEVKAVYGRILKKKG